MKVIDETGVDFVNMVVNRGVFNGVINIAFGTFLFTSTDDGKVDPDMVISSRLRMDEACAVQLHKALGELLQLLDEARANSAGATPPKEEEATEAVKPN